VDCGRAESDGTAERYVLGRLTATEVEEFESHYFDCDECFATVEALRAVKCQLEKDRQSVPQLAQRPNPTTRWWLALAAAVVATSAVSILVAWVLCSP